MPVVNLNARSESYAGFKTRWGADHYIFTAQGTDLDHSLKAEEIDGSGFGTRFKNNLPGMIDGTLKMSGLAAMKAGKVSWVFNQWLGRTSDVNVWYVTEGFDALSPIAMQPSSLMEEIGRASCRERVCHNV